MKPAAAASPDEVRKLLDDLNSDDFTTREKATAAVKKLGGAADDPLRAAASGRKVPRVPASPATRAVP